MKPKFEIEVKRDFVYLTANGKRLRKYPKTYPTGAYTLIGDYGLRKARADLKLIKLLLRGLK